MTTFSRELEQTLHRALALANERKHEYATLEHLLLALVSDQDAVAVMRACNVDIEKLSRSLIAYMDSDLADLVSATGEDSKPTAGFQRVIQRAVILVQSAGREEVTAANVLVAIFAEKESHAAYFLQEQDMTRYDAVNYISHGIAKTPGASTPVRSTHLRILSSEKDKALEDWFCAVVSSAGFKYELFRSILRPGERVPRILSEALNVSHVIAIITADFRKTALYDILSKKAVFGSITSKCPFIPLVVGPPVKTSPLGEVAQVSLSDASADAVCKQIFLALDYLGEYDTNSELLAAALRNRPARRKQKKTKAHQTDPELEQENLSQEPVPEPGPEFTIGSQGLSLQSSRLIDGLFDQRTQRHLHERLKQIAPLLAKASRNVSNSHQGLASVTSEYEDLVTRSFDELDVVSLWAVGAGLLANRDAFARAHDSRMMTEPLEPAHFALLQQVCEVHGGFILGFPQARELSERADRARISGAAMERVVSAAREIIDQLLNSSRQVDDRTRKFLTAIQSGLVEPGWKITRSGFAAYVVTRNALIAIGRLLNWANSAFATVIGGLILADVDPGLIHTQFWIEFVLRNSQQILAFAEPFPELKIWLTAQIQAARKDKEMRA
jgi:Clp amino terminal domain, pathogenicity island component